MKAIMNPRKEPLVAKTLRRSVTVGESRRAAPLRSTSFSKEDRLENLMKHSLQDLPPVGRSSALDDYFDKEIKVEQTQSQLNLHSRGDSGGSATKHEKN